MWKTPNVEEKLALTEAILNRASLPLTKVGQPIIMERVNPVTGKLQRLVSCGNTHDPLDPNADQYIAREFNVDHRQTIEMHHQWLSKMIVADPLPNDHYTTGQLIAMKLVGVYLWEDVPEEELVLPDAIVVSQ